MIAYGHKLSLNLLLQLILIAVLSLPYSIKLCILIIVKLNNNYSPYGRAHILMRINR